MATSHHQTHDTIERNIYTGMCEVRWIGTGLVTSRNYTVIYSGDDTQEKWDGILIDEERQLRLLGYWTVSDRIFV